jgi:transposase
MQTYGSIIPGGPTLARLLPRSAAEAWQPPPLSREAKRRLAAVRWYEEHGKQASLTARHFGLSRSTFHTWLKRYRELGLRGLEDRSRRPRRVRRPAWDADLQTRVLKLREAYPRWGKDKLTPILRREGIMVSFPWPDASSAGSDGKAAYRQRA